MQKRKYRYEARNSGFKALPFHVIGGGSDNGGGSRFVLGLNIAKRIVSR